MDYRTLPGSDLSVSTLCLGTMTFGEQNSEAEGHAQLDLAFDAGINFIDTAEMYPVPARAETQGSTEQIVGSWLHQQERSKIVLATKVSGPNRGMDWMRGGPQFTKEQIHAACDDSLRRLQTDYIDLYQLHWPARHVPMFGQTYYDPANEYANVPALADTLAALGELVSAGKVRHIGVSNETPWGVMECKRLAHELGVPVISTIQNVYNLINRGFEQGLAEVCHRENVMLLVYSPLAFGLLSGKYVTDPRTDGRMTRFANFGVRYLKPHVNEAVAAYAALAQEYDLTPAQLALGWVKSRWFAGSTILGATSIEQLQENLSVSDITLPDELLAAIEAIHRRCPNPAL